MKPPEVCKTMHAPQRAVWSALTDLSGMDGVLSEVRQVEILTDSSFEAGTQWRESRRYYGKPHVETLTVDAVHEPISYSVRAEGRAIEWSKTSELVALSPTTTEVTTRFVLRLRDKSGLWPRTMLLLFERIEAKILMQKISSDLDDLARHVQAHQYGY